MRTSFVTLFGLVASVAAIPATSMMKRQTDAALCGSGSAQCCSVDVLGVADLDCANPPTLPANTTDFNAICSSIGQIDMCCLIPILGQALLCEAPLGG